MSADFIAFSIGGTGSGLERKLIRSRAAAHSHRSGERKPKTKAGEIRPESWQSSGLTSRATSRQDSLAPEAPNESQDHQPDRPQCTVQNAGVHLNFKLVPQRDGIKRLAGPATPRGHSKISLSQLEGFDMLNSARIGRDRTYPVPEQPFFARYLDFMWPWMLRSWQNLTDTTSEERATAMDWVQRVTLSNPAYFYMNLLSVADVFSRHNDFDRQLLHWIMAQVVRAINDGLSQASTTLNAGVILAVGRIALHDIVLGDFEAGATIHRPAQARMLAMVGGIENVGLPSLVLKHVLWADRIMTERTGVSIDQIEPGAIRRSLLRPEQRQDEVVLASYGATKLASKC